jgi:hypothetical protein
VLVVYGLQQRVNELGWGRTRPHGQRTEIEGGGSPAGVAYLHDERHALSGRHVVHQEERQLRVNGLELDLVNGIVHERRDRRHRFEVPGLAKQPDGLDPDLRIGIAQVADDIVESRGLRCGPGSEEAGEQK